MSEQKTIDIITKHLWLDDDFRGKLIIEMMRAQNYVPQELEDKVNEIARDLENRLKAAATLGLSAAHDSVLLKELLLFLNGDENDRDDE